jgi:DNA-binding XRE family transcriptional regulator
MCTGGASRCSSRTGRGSGQISAVPTLRLSCEIPSKKPLLWEPGNHSLAEVLKKTRLEKGLLQRHVAKKFGCNKHTYHNWEVEYSCPTFEYSKKVRQFLGDNAQFLNESLREFKEEFVTADELCKILPMNKNTFESFVRRTLKMKPMKNQSGQAWIFFKDEIAHIKSEMKRRGYKPRKPISNG